MCNADRRDYERICNEFGVKDMEFVLKRLEEKKKERAQNKYKVCRNSSSQLRSNVLFSKKKFIQYVYSHRFESELSLDSFPNTHDKKWIEVIFSIVTTHELNIVCNSCVYCVRTVWFLAVPMMQTQHWTRTWRVLMRRRISVWRAWGRRTRGWIRWMLKSSTSSTESWIRWMKRASSSLRNINVGLNKRSRASGTESCCPCVFVQSLTTLVYQNSSFKVPFIMMTTIS